MTREWHRFAANVDIARGVWGPSDVVPRETVAGQIARGGSGGPRDLAATKNIAVPPV